MIDKRRREDPPADKRRVEVRNPRYAGATPEDVGRALLRRVDNGRDDPDEDSESARCRFQSSI